jgi:hypothetical protein
VTSVSKLPVPAPTRPATPQWRRGFDLVEREAARKIAEVSASDAFAIAFGLTRRVRRQIAGQTERTSRHLLHVLNLPAGSDVTRLLGQIASLEREVRALRRQVAGEPMLQGPAGCHLP